MVQLVSESTHKNSVIDHIYLSSSIICSDLELLPPVENYHCVIRTILNFPLIKRSKCKSVARPLWSRANWDSIAAKMDELDLGNAVDNSSNINTAWSCFRNGILNVIKDSVPLSVPRSSHNPWFNRNIAKLIRLRDKLYKRWQSSRLQRDYAKYLKRRKQVKKAVAKAKQQYVDSQFAFSTKNAHRFWKATRALSGAGKRLMPSLRREDGSLAVSDEDKSHLLALHFASVWNAYDKAKSADHQQFVTQHVVEQRDLCSSEFVHQQLSKLKTSKASGVDNIPAVFLKNMADKLSLPIAALINRTIASGVIPDQWKLARITPVPKVRNSQNPANYRPISVLCIVGLIAEKFIYSKIYSRVDRLLPAWQYGFRQGRSTLDALIHFEESVVQGWIECTLHKKATEVAVLSVDVRKAFDTLPHRVIIEKLQQCDSLPIYFVNWIRFYLHNRQQFVQLRTARSPPACVLSGVPQGSVLGPLLFIVSTASIQDVPLSPSTSLISYADDLILSKPLLSHQSVKDFQNDVDLIVGSLSSLGLKVNCSKTNLFVATTSRIGHSSTSTDVSSFQVEGSMVERVYVLKFLGVLFEPNLSMRLHAFSVAARARRMLGCVYGTLRRWRQWCALQRIYLQVIRPIMSYSLPLVLGITAGGDNSLNRVDSKALRLVTNNGEIPCGISWPSLKEIAQAEMMQRVFGVLYGRKTNVGDFLQIKESVRLTRLSGGVQLSVLNSFSRNNRCTNSYLRRACRLFNNSLGRRTP